MAIAYSSSRQPTLDQVIDLYRASTLGQRRPVDSRHVMQGMVDNADLMVTAWDGDVVVGIARTLTDFTYCAYLADLAVHLDWQRQGIGTELIEATKRLLEPTCFVTLLSAPAANDYYPRVGFDHHPRAWMWAPD